MSDEPKQAARRTGTFGESLKAVGWAFFGVRKRSAFENDATRLNPLHLVIAAVVAAALFIAALIAVVNWVVAGTAAT